MSDAPDWMTSRAELKDGFPLDVQSRGRELKTEERALAVALEAIFSKGVHDMGAVAAGLNSAGLPPPVDASEWTASNLIARLAAINADLDRAFEEHGYGA